MFQVIGFWLIELFSLLIMWEITFTNHQKANRCFIFCGNATINGWQEWKEKHSPFKNPTTFLFLGSSALKNNGHIWAHTVPGFESCVKKVRCLVLD